MMIPYIRTEDSEFWSCPWRKSCFAGGECFDSGRPSEGQRERCDEEYAGGSIVYPMHELYEQICASSSMC